jgi:Na+-translocating ferredoxin:NAD+ oxidoreductase RnfD subunit
MSVMFESQSAQDAVTMATPLDALRTQLHSAGGARHGGLGILGSHASFGNIGGKGWEWIALAYLAGGLWLLQQRIITWHVPAAFLRRTGAHRHCGFSLGDAPTALPGRSSTSSPAAPCWAPSSSSPTRSPAPPRRAAS